MTKAKIEKKEWVMIPDVDKKEPAEEITEEKIQAFRNREWARRNQRYLVRYNRERRHAFIAAGLRFDGKPRKS